MVENNHIKWLFWWHKEYLVLICIFAKKAKYVFGYQNIKVGFINQLERTMKIVLCKMWISKIEIHFLKKIMIIFEIAFYSFKSKRVVD